MGNDPSTPDTSGSGGAPAGPGNQARQGFAARLLAHPHWQLATAMIGTVAAVVGIVGAFHFGSSGGTSAAAGAATSTSIAPSVPSPIDTAETSAPSGVDSTTGDPPALSTSRDVAPALEPGVCLSADQQPLPCTAIHRHEVVAINTADCDAAVAMPYLAGNPELDVIRARFTLTDNQACLVADHSDTDRSAPIKGIMAASDLAVASAFRLCRDDRTAPTEVGCDVPHTSEFIGSLGVAAPNQSQCEAAASAYLSRTFNDVNDRLKVASIPTSDPASKAPNSVITTRGNAVLTQTLRDVRTNALPLTPG